MAGEQSLRALLFVAGVAALIAGIYGRFAGLGTWPLGVDEFYISRSIENIMHRGVPAFPCGGYYTRGLVYQYAVAGLRLGGLSAEFAGRLVAAVSSLAMLPAAYLLGRRLESRLAGVVVVILLCVSIWEIEMARFARMYAPFQAVFTWYLVYFVRYAADRDASALKWMVGLSTLGVLTWEGGALLGICNLLAVLLWHEDGRFTAAHWRRIVGLSLLLGVFYLVTRDLRGFVDAPAAEGAVVTPVAHASALDAWLGPLHDHPAWGLGLLLPLMLLVRGLPWVAGLRRRPLACVGVCAVALAVAAHALLAAAAVTVLLGLTHLMSIQDLRCRNARHYGLSLLAFASFWCVVETAANGFSKAGIAAIANQLLGFPDVYGQVLRPWGRALLLLTLGMVAAVLYVTVRSLIEDASRPSAGAKPSALAALLSLVLVMALAVGATATLRVETRYTFFLYPALLVLTVSAMSRLWVKFKVLRALPVTLSAVIPLACFAMTEDFQPRHLAEIDSAKVNFRVGMSAVQASHFYPRNDVTGAAAWLDVHVQPGDVVMSGVPNLDPYDRHIDYFFLNDADRYESYVCSDDRTERWTNHPVLYTWNALKPIVSSGHRVFASLYGYDVASLRAYAPAAGWRATAVWSADSNTTHVWLIEARATGTGTP